MDINDDYAPEQESLGSLLRTARLERALDISEVSEETRIPQHTIRAMEADDYAELPAYPFARGFYSLYAKLLELDQEEVLGRFAETRQQSGQTRQQEQVHSPSWQHKQIGSMAEKPSITAGSIIGSGLLVLILAAAAISWYAGFNPATHLSQWLRTIQEKPVEALSEEGVSGSVEPDLSPEAATSDPAGQPTTPRNDQPGTTATEAYQYQLEAIFGEQTEVRITVDDQLPTTLLLPAGARKRWQARERISLEMAPDTTARLVLNGIDIPLPEAVNGRILVEIPEYLLDQDGGNPN